MLCLGRKHVGVRSSDISTGIEVVGQTEDASGEIQRAGLLRTLVGGDSGDYKQLYKIKVSAHKDKVK